MLELEFAQLSDPGRLRAHNQDYLGHFIPADPAEARGRGWLFVLADGVGGQDRGEIASRTAVETLLEKFRHSVPRDSLSTLLPRLVQAANEQVYETAMTFGPGGSRMATTLVACALRFDRATISHVGDSRCYLIRRGYAASLTRDHTVSNEQLRLGLITSREAAQANTAHLLSRSIGGDMFVNAETSEHQIFLGDVLALSSDGLHGSVSEQDMVRALADEANLQSAAQQLVQLAKTRDGSDNVSVLLIRIRGVERVGMYRGRHYQLR